MSKSATILCADDDPRSLKLIEAIFSSTGYNTIAVTDGQSAVDIMLSRRVDLVITDVLMPNVDGYYLMYKMRQHPQLSQIPVIIYTATYTALSEEQVAEDMGADLFIRKPTSSQTLLNAASKLLQEVSVNNRKTVNIPESVEVMHQYSSDLVNKLEQRNIALEEIKKKLEITVLQRTLELQTTNEELVATNEELQASNEELLAINEKLQEASEVISKQAEVIVRQKDEQLNRVLDASNDVIWSEDLTNEGNSYVSRSAERLLGVPLENILQDITVWHAAVCLEDKAEKEKAFIALQQQDEVTCTYRLMNQNDEVRWMRETIRIDRNSANNPVRRYGIATDITSIKDAELKLMSERNLLRAIIDNIPDYIFVKDLALRHVINNKSFVNVLHAKTEAETLGKTAIDYFGDAALDFIDEDRTVLHTGVSIINREETGFNDAHERINILTTKVPLYNENNKIIGLIGIIRDITAYKKQELVVSQHQEKLDIIFSNTKETILLLDHEGRIILFNQALINFLTKANGIKPEIGQYLWESTTDNRREIAKSLFQRAVNGEEIYTEARIDMPDGPVDIEIHYQPIFIDGIVKFVILVTLDITELRKNENELKHSQFLTNTAFDVARLGYWSYNSKTKESEWNKLTRQMLGIPDSIQSTIENFLLVIHPEDKERVEIVIKQAIENHKLFDIEHRIIRQTDGAVRWIHQQGDFTATDYGSKLLIGVIEDITQRKTIEEVLIEYNERYEMLSKATNDAIWDWDILHDIEIWNHGIYSIFGYTEQKQISSQTWWKEKVHPDDYERVQMEIATAFSNKETNWTSQFRYRCADGSYKDILDRAYIIYLEGKPIRMIGAMQDITAQKEFEHKITNIARELSSLIENANAPIFGTDKNGYINEWNKVTSALTGYSRNEVLGIPLIQFISANKHKGFKKVLVDVAAGIPISNLEIPVQTKSGDNLIVLLNATPRKDLNQNYIGTLMVGQNITEIIEYRKNLEEKVRARTEELNQALLKEKEIVEMKSRFVSIASHEFRTPLSTITMASGLLRNHIDKLTRKEIENKLLSIEKQVSHMTYLLDDILLIGKAESGKIKANSIPITIDEFFRQISIEVESSMPSHRIEYISTCSIESFSSDEKLLRNITINLLTNAIKFSPGKEVVKFTLTNSKYLFTIKVKDLGIGITNEDQARLFNPFQRGSNVGDIDGTGLGLSIVKKAVDLLKGSIRVESTPGAGTTFTVSLPITGIDDLNS